MDPSLSDAGPWEYPFHAPKKATFPPIPVNLISVPAMNFGPSGSTPTAFAVTGAWNVSSFSIPCGWGLGHEHHSQFFDLTPIQGP